MRELATPSAGLLIFCSSANSRAQHRRIVLASRRLKTLGRPLHLPVSWPKDIAGSARVKPIRTVVSECIVFWTFGLCSMRFGATYHGTMAAVAFEPKGASSR